MTAFQKPRVALHMSTGNNDAKAQASLPEQVSQAPLNDLPQGEPDGLTENAWAEWLDERNRLFARFVVRRAENVLVERYGLEDLLQAFSLLKEASQQFNVKLHTVADAVARVDGPAPGRSDWFPGRRPDPAPSLGTLNLVDNKGGRLGPPQGAVLSAALDRTLSIAGAAVGHVHLAETGVRRLAQSSGLDGPFTEYAKFTQDQQTAWDWAAAENRQITVEALSSSEMFTPRARTMMLRSGSRACHCVPLTHDHDALAVVTVHAQDRLTSPLSQMQLTDLQELAAETGAWLEWHRRTIVLNCLELLHHRAQAQ
ncbi:ANTAR domain protein [Streptomyces sp. YIM 130001]|uniref:ANTAR domain-containing protein n=1 Tax=Streptomyces sp. YIM 130001 TaxID=2259644 RepID=UPI000E6536F4|nr:ANTAR domain-containing protein [Streptomyces sp. YIM 130001]RII17896.1 ANTAR domain protein [Streptomyces sp. YIM 130001]